MHTVWLLWQASWRAVAQRVSLAHTWLVCCTHPCVVHFSFHFRHTVESLVEMSGQKVVLTSHSYGEK